MGSAVITGYGFVTPLGDCSDTHFDALVAACSNVPQYDSDVPEVHQPIESNQVCDELLKSHLTGRNLRPLDRTSRLLAAAAGNSLTQAGIEQDEATTIGLVSGTMFSSAATISAFDCRAVEEGPAYASALDFANSVINASTGQTAIWHRLRGENTTVATGQSSGLKAIARGRDSIGSGRADILLAGGVEELSREIYSAFSDSGLVTGRERAVPFATDRNGFILREAAATIVLEDARHARARGATILGEVVGSGSAFDCLARNDQETSVASIATSMRLALSEANVDPKQMDLIVVSANGSVEADQHESLAINSVFGADHGCLMLAPKILHGECNGAGGPLQLIALLQCTQRGRYPTVTGLKVPTRPVRTALINSVSFDGHACSLVIRMPQFPEWN